MADVLYRWPAAAHFGRRVAKEKILEHAAVKPAVRAQFVSSLQRIIWAFKLAETTIRLPGSQQVPEIQILSLDAKEDDVPSSVLQAIDKAIPYPLLFEVTRRSGEVEEVRMTAALKEHARAGGSNAYCSTQWLPATMERRQLPTAISLEGLYSAILEPLLPIQARADEPLSEVAARLERVRKLEREVASLERQLRAEQQFNRKVEIRRILKAKQHEVGQER